MILAKIRVSGTRAIVLDAAEIPMGINGGKIALEYADPIWDGLTTTSHTIPAGKHSGSGKVSLTSDIENALAAI